MKRMKTVRPGRLAALLLALLTLSCAALAEEAPAVADDGPARIELSTQYPALVAKAGDSLTFDLDIENQSGASQDIALSAVSVPEGWTSSFSASSKQVSLVHVKDGDTNSSVDFALDIPLDAADGEYVLTLQADADGFSDTMDIYLTLDAEEIGESSFTVEYPSQEGDADTAFSYSAILANNTLSNQSYAFSATAPSGWSVSFAPSGETTKVASLEVEARTTQSVDIDITPPADIESGTYEILCSATSADEKVSLPLSITITGSYDLALSTPSGLLSLDAYANQESPLQLTITNSGNTALTQVNLTSSAPTGWSVRFSQETIDLIEPGATVETTAYITPGEEAMSGDYVTTLSAGNSDASDMIELRITVKTETKWGVIGIGVIVVLAVVMLAVMRRFGRR